MSVNTMESESLEYGPLTKTAVSGSWVWTVNKDHDSDGVGDGPSTKTLVSKCLGDGPLTKTVESESLGDGQQKPQ